MQMPVAPSYSDLERRVLSRITEQRWLDLASELIRTGQPRLVAAYRRNTQFSPPATCLRK